MSKKKPEHYVDNKLFYSAMVEFLENRVTDPEYKIPDYIGECVYKIASRIVYMPNFINYPYRDEMVGDSIENCIRYIDRFSPDKSKNPFAYYSQICYWACVRRIQIEQKQVEKQARIVQSGSLYMDAVATMDKEEPEYFNTDSMSNLEYLYNYEIKEKPTQKAKKKPTEYSLDEFM